MADPNRIKTSIHGRRLGLGYSGELVVGAEGGSRQMMRHFRDLTITSAQVLALNAAPQAILPAPGAGFANIFEGAMIHKPAGTAYAGIAAGEDLSVRYTDLSGAEAALCETTGFLDQATAQTRFVRGQSALVTTASQITPVDNAAMVIGLLTGEITTGTSALHLRVFYSVVPMVLPAV